jgi:hypothetical protein
VKKRRRSEAERGIWRFTPAQSALLKEIKNHYKHDCNGQWTINYGHPIEFFVSIGVKKTGNGMPKKINSKILLSLF